MYPRPGKIRKTTGMIQIHVRQQNVSDVLRPVTQLLHLLPGTVRQILAHPKSQSAGQRPAAVTRVEIRSAQTSVHQYQPLVGFHQQTMTAQ